MSNNRFGLLWLDRILFRIHGHRISIGTMDPGVSGRRLLAFARNMFGQWRSRHRIGTREFWDCNLLPKDYYFAMDLQRALGILSLPRIPHPVASQGLQSLPLMQQTIKRQLLWMLRTFGWVKQELRRWLWECYYSSSWSFWLWSFAFGVSEGGSRHRNCLCIDQGLDHDRKHKRRWRICFSSTFY